MNFVLSFILGAACFAIALRLAVAILDRGNSSNTWGAALLFGAIFALPAALGVGVLFGLIPLVALLLILIRFYDLGIGRSLLVVILMGVLNFAMALMLAPLLLALGL